MLLTLFDLSLDLEYGEYFSMVNMENSMQEILRYYHSNLRITKIAKGVTDCAMCFLSVLGLCLCSVQPALSQVTKAGSSNEGTGLMGATEEQAKPLKGGEQFVGSIIEKREAFHVKGIKQTIAIPSNFPLQTYPNNVTSTNFVSATVGTPVAAVSLITRDQPKMVYDWYYKQCADHGWSISTPPETAKTAKEKNGTMYRMSALKDGQQLVLAFMQMKKSPRTFVSINWILKYKT